MKPPPMNTLEGIRAFAKAVASGTDNYQVETLAKLVLGLADYIDSLEVVPCGPDRHILRPAPASLPIGEGEPR